MPIKTRTALALLLSALSVPIPAATVITVKPEALKCGRRYTLEGIDNCEIKFSVEVTTDNVDKDFEQVFGSCRTVLRLYIPPDDNPALQRLLGFPSREPGTLETRDETYTHDFNLFARYGHGTTTLWKTFGIKPTGSTVIGAGLVHMECQQQP